MPIITSLLDTDQYIFTMAQAALHQCSGVMAKFRFKCRNGTGVVRDENGSTQQFLARLNVELDHLCSLTFTESELEYLSTIRYFKRDFVDMLCLLKLNRSHIFAYIDKNGWLQIEIEGPIFLTIWFEVPVLAIVSQLLGEKYSDFDVGRDRLYDKINFLQTEMKSDPFHFVDFGTRRRHSFHWHEDLILTLKKEVPEYFVGTSNVYFAMKHGLTPIGTMAHLWFMMFQRMRYRLGVSQKAALDAWQKEYQGDLGIALSDTGGFAWFLKDFNLFYAKLFDGCRHDSGDPYAWCHMLVEHYKKLGIDPKSKTAVFSDGLTFPLAVDLFKTCHPHINTSFGIGTHLTNDMGYTAPQIVIKMTECQGGPVSKRSDSKGKGMCEDPEFDAYFAKVIKEEIANGTV